MDGNSPGKRGAKKKKGLVKKPLAVEVSKSKELDKGKAKVNLEHVLGMTVYANSALTCEPKSGMVAYPSGSVLVLLDSVKNKQVGTLHTPRKSITAASFSPDGRYVVTGESGLQPAVRVWEVSHMEEVATLRGHSVGIASVSFSPRMREIIVVGEAQDMMISVWAWPSKVMTALNKFADQIYAMAVSEDSRFFVIVGNRHVKFYYMDILRTQAIQVDSTCPIPLPVRCGILDNLKENCFCDVICGRGCSSMYIFVITVSGILCQINRNRLLERWVNVNMCKACCLTADESNVFVGGAKGVVRMFRALDLQIILTLPRPHSLGLDISQVTTAYIEDASEDITVDEGEDDRDEQGARHPSTRALSYDAVHGNLTVVYDDHSIYIWQRTVGDSPSSDEWVQFSKKYSSMYHRGCVWDVTTYPVALAAESEEGALGGALPPGALISVSADGTLRAWDVSAKICEESMLKRNCLSAECLKIVYADKSEPHKKPRDKTRQQTKSRDGAVGSHSRHGKQSFSVVAVCPDGLHIATGNRNGRVSIYDTNTMNVKATMLAHEAEVTALGYSMTKRYKVLASGSRDRMIHVMDALHGYQLLTTLDDHSSTITAINFTYMARCLLMITSSLDMSVLVRAYLESDVFSFKPVRAIVEKKAVMDITIHPWSGLMALVCQDRFVRIYSIMSSVESSSFRGCPSYGGHLIKIQIDPSGQYLLTACSNKTINLLQFNTGTILSTFNGHAESITCVKFSHNMKHVISAAVDGCIFLWRLPKSVTYTVKREMAEMGRLTRGMVLSERWKQSRLLEGFQPIDVRSEPMIMEPVEANELKATSSVADTHEESDIKIGQGAYRDGDLMAEGAARNRTESPLVEHGVEYTDQADDQVVVEGELGIWIPSSIKDMLCESSFHAQGDEGVIRMMEDEQRDPQNARSYSPAIVAHTSFCPTSEAWLTACYERRRIFKLEARSIKKILAMMRLVTDAMEKDLANADLLKYATTNMGANNNLSEANFFSQEPEETESFETRGMEMVVSAAMRPVEHQQHPHTILSSHQASTSATQLQQCPHSGESQQQLQQQYDSKQQPQEKLQQHEQQQQEQQKQQLQHRMFYSSQDAAFSATQLKQIHYPGQQQQQQHLNLSHFSHQSSSSAAQLEKHHHSGQREQTTPPPTPLLTPPPQYPQQIQQKQPCQSYSSHQMPNTALHLQHHHTTPLQQQPYMCKSYHETSTTAAELHNHLRQGQQHIFPHLCHCGYQTTVSPTPLQHHPQQQQQQHHLSLGYNMQEDLRPSPSPEPKPPQLLNVTNDQRLLPCDQQHWQEQQLQQNKVQQEQQQQQLHQQPQQQQQGQKEQQQVQQHHQQMQNQPHHVPTIPSKTRQSSRIPVRSHSASNHTFQRRPESIALRSNRRRRYTDSLPFYSSHRGSVSCTSTTEDPTKSLSEQPSNKIQQQNYSTPPPLLQRSLFQCCSEGDINKVMRYAESEPENCAGRSLKSPCDQSLNVQNGDSDRGNGAIPRAKSAQQCFSLDNVRNRTTIGTYSNIEVASGNDHGVKLLKETAPGVSEEDVNHPENNNSLHSGSNYSYENNFSCVSAADGSKGCLVGGQLISFQEPGIEGGTDAAEEHNATPVSSSAFLNNTVLDQDKIIEENAESEAANLGLQAAQAFQECVFLSKSDVGPLSTRSIVQLQKCRESVSFMYGKYDRIERSESANNLLAMFRADLQSPGDSERHWLSGMDRSNEEIKSPETCERCKFNNRTSDCWLHDYTSSCYLMLGSDWDEKELCYGNEIEGPSSSSYDDTLSPSPEAHPNL